MPNQDFAPQPAQPQPQQKSTGKNTVGKILMVGGVLVAAFVAYFFFFRSYIEGIKFAEFYRWYAIAGLVVVGIGVGFYVNKAIKAGELFSKVGKHMEAMQKPPERMEDITDMLRGYYLDKKSWDCSFKNTGDDVQYGFDCFKFTARIYNSFGGECALFTVSVPKFVKPKLSRKNGFIFHRVWDGDEYPKREKTIKQNLVDELYASEGFDELGKTWFAGKVLGQGNIEEVVNEK